MTEKPPLHYYLFLHQPSLDVRDTAVFLKCIAIDNDQRGRLFHAETGNKIALFISEVLYHVLRHPMPDEQMFDFIRSAVERLDATDAPQNFHLCFLAEFAALLGFAIDPTNPLSALQNGTDIPFSRTERQEVLRKLCAYFAEHVETWQDPKSLDVLMEVFD